jgi:hypothetical protein
LPPSRLELRLGVVESRAISRGFEQLIKCLRNGAADIGALFSHEYQSAEELVMKTVGRRSRRGHFDSTPPAANLYSSPCCTACVSTCLAASPTTPRGVNPLLAGDYGVRCWHWGCHQSYPSRHPCRPCSSLNRAIYRPCCSAFILPASSSRAFHHPPTVLRPALTGSTRSSMTAIA